MKIVNEFNILKLCKDLNKYKKTGVKKFTFKNNSLVKNYSIHPMAFVSTKTAEEFSLVFGIPVELYEGEIVFQLPKDRLITIRMDVLKIIIRRNKNGK